MARYVCLEYISVACCPLKIILTGDVAHFLFHSVQPTSVNIRDSYFDLNSIVSLLSNPEI
jgi:hypothetical protein